MNKPTAKKKIISSKKHTSKYTRKNNSKISNREKTNPNKTSTTNINRSTNTENKDANPKLTLEILNKTVTNEFAKLKTQDLDISQSLLDKMKDTELGKQQITQLDYIKGLVVTIINRHNSSIKNLKSKKIDEFVPTDGNYKDDACILGKYHIKKLVPSGSGGFGKVYKFKNGKHTFAVKVVDISQANENSMLRSWGGMTFYTVEQMEKEANIARHLGELGIGPKIHDVYYCVNKNKIKYYYVMDYMNRGSLMNYMRKNNIKVLAQEYIDKIIAKLEKMHNAGYIHDDLHTGNILVHEPQKGKLEFYISDFGLSNKISAKLDNESKDLINELKYDGNPEKKRLAIQTEYITRMILNTYVIPELSV